MAAARKGQDDNIKVYLRVRPVSEAQQPEVPLFAWTETQIEPRLGGERRKKSFNFQRVFGPQVTNAAVQKQVSRIAVDALHGINSTVLAYGQTASGKTHTMTGSRARKEPGVVQLTIAGLLDGAGAHANWEWNFEASYFEVHNDKVYDLLVGQPTELMVHTDSSDGHTTVLGLSSHPLRQGADLQDFLELGEEHRRTARTNLNDHSSRSHTIVQVKGVGLNHTSGKRRESIVRLVDLAGSENAKTAGTSGDTKREGDQINKSLHQLTNVIQALRDGSPYVPYRNSRLTRILSSSLGGNSRTVIICCVSPATKSFDEALSTLHFADNAQRIVNNVVVNERDGMRMVSIAAVERMMDQWRADIAAARAFEKKQIKAIAEEWRQVMSQAEEDVAAELRLWSKLRDSDERMLQREQERCKGMAAAEAAAEEQFNVSSAESERTCNQLTADAAEQEAALAAAATEVHRRAGAEALASAQVEASFAALLQEHPHLAASPQLTWGDPVERDDILSRVQEEVRSRPKGGKAAADRTRARPQKRKPRASSVGTKARDAKAKAGAAASRKNPRKANTVAPASPAPSLLPCVGAMMTPRPRPTTPVPSPSCLSDPRLVCSLQAALSTKRARSTDRAPRAKRSRADLHL
eukprot:TRINITY_DN35783_c0_g1_i1.p1 TRINITY_DN35783_c0_g1~~TRINITY_DN35783_c0_g1_i1.p1  ORF type:complete len:651 (+),score=225.84 TRINITY_DN35783_c0_g1_i1:45-1955(+)